MLPISNNRYRKPAAFDNFPGIVVVSTLLGDIEMGYVSGWVAVGQGWFRVQSFWFLVFDSSPQFRKFSGKAR